MPTKDPRKRAAKQRRRYHRNPAKARARKAAYRTKNRAEIQARDRKYHADNRDEVNRRARTRYTKKGRPAKQLNFPPNLLFPEVFSRHRRDVQYRTLYKITLKEFEAAKAAQGNRCLGCRRDFDEPGMRAVADHDRITGEFRGVLCNHCNLALGHAYENHVYYATS